MLTTKTDVLALRIKAVNSLVLAIEIFNRPHENGRAEAVLILLHHSFEMLLKAYIAKRTGTVFSKDQRYSYSFDTCLEIAQIKLRAISIDHRSTLSMLDAQRDACVHYYQDISEDLLYLHSQSAVSLFDELLTKFFNIRLSDIVPARVLPISTRPPKDIQLLINSELEQIDGLLKARGKNNSLAEAKLRPLLALTTGSRPNAGRVTVGEIKSAVRRRRKGEDWTVIMPEIAQLELATSGDGIPFNFRISKDAKFAVRIAEDGEEVQGTLIKQEINIWDKFNLSTTDLANKLQLTQPKMGALILELDIKSDQDCYKELKHKSIVHKGYSKKALDRLREALNNGVDINEIWARHGHHFGSRRKA